MYYFHEYDKTYGAPFAWFIAENRSVYEVETMIGRGILNINNIKKHGNKLLVCFINTDDYYIRDDLAYHLYVIESPTNPGNMHIKLIFEKPKHVNNMWRMPVDGNQEMTKNIDDHEEFGELPEQNSYPADYTGDEVVHDTVDYTEDVIEDDPEDDQEYDIQQFS